MQDNEFATTQLLARVERLEKENSRFKSVALLTLVGAAALLVMAPGRRTAQNPPAAKPAEAVVTEVRARKFVLVDEKGTVRATLGTQSLGWPYLSRAALILHGPDPAHKAMLAADNALNQITLENNDVGTGTKLARMQIGTDGLGLELSEFILKTSAYNRFGVSWPSETPEIPETAGDKTPRVPRLELNASHTGVATVWTPGTAPLYQSKR